jgi:hypothetical protein
LGNYATVSGGINNTSSGYFSTVSGGINNINYGDQSFIGGGCCNIVELIGDSLLGGVLNQITSSPVPLPFVPVPSNGHRTIGGGFANLALGTFSVIGGGQQNTASGCYGSTVSGGGRNTSSGYYSTVSGGANNTSINGCSAILGGQCNTAQHDCSFIVGSGIFSTAANTLHINCLNIKDLPDETAIGLPLGTVFYDSTTCNLCVCL